MNRGPPLQGEQKVLAAPQNRRRAPHPRQPGREGPSRVRRGRALSCSRTAALQAPCKGAARRPRRAMGSPTGAARGSLARAASALTPPKGAQRMSNAKFRLREATHTVVRDIGDAAEKRQRAPTQRGVSPARAGADSPSKRILRAASRRASAAAAAKEAGERQAAARAKRLAERHDAMNSSLGEARGGVVFDGASSVRAEGQWRFLMTMPRRASCGLLRSCRLAGRATRAGSPRSTSGSRCSRPRAPGSSPTASTPSSGTR